MTFVIAILLVLVALIVFPILIRTGVMGAGLGRGVSGLMIFVALLLLISKAVTIIPAGHVGVVDLFGRVNPETLKSGIQFVNPLARVVKMSIQTQEIKEAMDVPSKEGLTMQLEMSVLYHLDPEKAQDVYRTVGEEFAGVLLGPQFRSVARGVTASYDAKALYTSEREQLALVISSELRQLVEKRGIVIEATPMRKLTLPQRLSGAIEEKLGAEQESQRMQFVLMKEKQEADRKRIEAEGISDFQKIVSQGINDGLLRWKGIEATMKIAESQNAKVVIIGSGKDGLPIILGDK
jgi:regulator of protease activity HflC (stomatin/prohibitin superfamily)